MGDGPRDWGDDLAAYHLGEGLDFGGVGGCGDGVEGVEGGRGGFGLEVDHVEDGADADVGGEGLQHEVCVGVLVGVGLVLEGGGEERGHLVERVAFDPAPYLADGVGGEGEGGDDAWMDCEK